MSMHFYTVANKNKLTITIGANNTQISCCHLGRKVLHKAGAGDGKKEQDLSSDH